MTASDPATSALVDESSLWSEAARLYRRICLLRLQGQSLEAARLQSTELSRTISALREATGHSSDGETKLAALLAREDERVTDASVLAEILLPLLREAVPAGSPAVTRPPRASAPAAPRHPRSAGERGIADFIDEMIQLERPAPPGEAP